MKSRRGRHYVAAMVLGTALSALGSSAPAMAGSIISENTIDNISRYCTASWRNARLPVDRWGDCTHEVLARLLDRVGAAAWERLLAPESEERRELIRAIDAVKKRTLRDCRRTIQLQGTIADDRDSSARERAESCEAVRQAAAKLLSPRQQRIVQLSFAGCSVAEIARVLSLPVERVSDEKYKAIRRLRGHFQSDLSA